jgi:hypothetical protein
MLILSDAVVFDGACCRFVTGVLQACRQLGVRGRLVHYDVEPRGKAVSTDSSEPSEQVSHLIKYFILQSILHI